MENCTTGKDRIKVLRLQRIEERAKKRHAEARTLGRVIRAANLWTTAENRILSVDKSHHV